MALEEQCGWIGDAALPSSGKRYFNEAVSYKVDPFGACGDYVRKLSRRDNDDLAAPDLAGATGQVQRYTQAISVHGVVQLRRADSNFMVYRGKQ